MPHKGETCRCAIPVPDGSTTNPQTQAITALQELCSGHGLTATNIRLVSAKPWTEPVGGQGPHEGVTLHIYAATAA